jgi:hypothetical protein
MTKKQAFAHAHDDVFQFGEENAREFLDEHNAAPARVEGPSVSKRPRLDKWIDPHASRAPDPTDLVLLLQESDVADWEVELERYYATNCGEESGEEDTGRKTGRNKCLPTSSIVCEMERQQRYFLY